MLKTLIIKNLILVEEATISFGSGLTVITGETGAGKTALIEAIRLILGERADVSKLRKGAQKGVIQGVFALPLSRKFHSLLVEEGGICFSEDEDLILTRELTATGKGRAFVAGQAVPLSFLQKISSYLVDFISQGALTVLRSHENQRALLDLFAEIDLISFQELWAKEKILESQLQKQLEDRSNAEQRELYLRQQLEELGKVDLEAKDTVFEEYSRLANSQELLLTSSQILEKTGDTTTLAAQIQSLVQKLIKYDSSLEEAAKMAKESHLQLVELDMLLQSFQAKIEDDPNRLLYLEEVLKQLEKLNKIHGPDLLAAKKAIEEELLHLLHLDEEIEKYSKQLEAAKKMTAAEVKALSDKRKKGATILEKLLSTSLQELNIPSAKISIEFSPAARSESGEDRVAFYLQANLGEKPAPVKEGASGGELSRILFALKILLADKNQPQTMIFDEIDANVGGKTATEIGKKLKNLGSLRQVICITHFPQVASHADEHLRVTKKERGNRTICTVDSLDPKAKEAELLRMLGGEKALIDFYTGNYQS